MYIGVRNTPSPHLILVPDTRDDLIIVRSIHNVSALFNVEQVTQSEDEVKGHKQKELVIIPLPTREE